MADIDDLKAPLSRSGLSTAGCCGLLVHWHEQMVAFPPFSPFPSTQGALRPCRSQFYQSESVSFTLSIRSVASSAVGDHLGHTPSPSSPKRAADHNVCRSPSCW